VLITSPCADYLPVRCADHFPVRWLLTCAVCWSLSCGLITSLHALCWLFPCVLITSLCCMLISSLCEGCYKKDAGEDLEHPVGADKQINVGLIPSALDDRSWHVEGQWFCQGAHQGIKVWVLCFSCSWTRRELCVAEILLMWDEHWKRNLKTDCVAITCQGSR